MSHPSVPTPGDGQPELGLRERKKLITRRNIADAAFALTLERGLDDVTIDQIAERAFVSPRTVSNYFPSKEAAVVATEAYSPAALLAGLEERPADENPLASVREVLVAAMRRMPREDVRALKQREQLVDRYPALQPHRAAQYVDLEDAIRLTVAARAGLDAETDPHPRLVAGAATAAYKTAIRVWVNTKGRGDNIADLMEQAFRDLEAGLSSDD
ncbi:TetR family transcriptional regulator [Agrococcus sp. HG114]|uniref:acyl-CoA-like ligand-binding transcription factor n=1 Tax=Agrococcus sp. HG114 TaxID=2969757 RepID=UPI00215AA934|nr:TetR family transcriptional regulator [Agrococcus sp. HG114]MCR8670699.1 TetR family transcriptional regulator [Agrococcus sp. HG114]